MKKLFLVSAILCISTVILMGQGAPPSTGNAKKIRSIPISRAIPTDNFILKFDDAVDSFMLEADLTGSGTSDSIAVDTDGNGTIDAYCYSTAGAIVMLKAGTGMVLTIATDTITFSTTLGIDISSAEIINQTIDKTDIDSTASNVVFDNAYEGTSALADSQYSTKNFVKKEILDSLGEYVLLNGARAMTANWSYGNFDLTGANVGGFDTLRTDVLRALGGETSVLLLEADTLKPDADKEMWLGTLANRIRMMNLYDFDLYTGGNNGGAYDTSDVPSDLQQLTWTTGGAIRWEAQGSGGGGNLFKLGIDPDDGAGAASLINNDSVVLQGTSTIRLTLDNTAGPVDTVDLAVGDGSLLDVKMGNNALDADKIVGDATDDDDLDVAAGGTGVSTLTDGGLLIGGGTADITALGVATNGQIPIGDGTTAPILGTITGTANEIDVTNGAGTITIGIVNPLGTAQGGTGVTDPAVWRTKNTSDTITYVGGDTLLIINREDQTVDTVVIRPGGTHFLEVEADRLDISGDVIDDFQGTGLTLSGTALATTLGTSVDLASAEVTGTLPVENGGTEATSLTQGGILQGNGTGAITPTAVLTNGQLLIGDGTTFPTVGTLTQGTGITVTNGAGTITIDATLGTDITGSEILDQTIAKADIDTTASNIAFDNAFHITTNATDSAYGSLRYAQARAGDTAAALRNGDTWTGTHVYTSAVITLPNGVNPTTATEGDISWDTDDDALEVTDGTNDVLIPFQRTISFAVWDPELLTDTVSIFYCDSTIYQGGVTLTSFEAQTNVDGAYTLKLFEFNANDPPDTTGVGVGSGTLASLAFGATDQRDQSTTFAGSGTIARGNSVAILTPSTNISWLRVSITFRVNENN